MNFIFVIFMFFILNNTIAHENSEKVQNDDFSTHLKEMEFSEIFSLPEIILGDENAPKNVIIYSSYTCLHCQKFQQTELEQFIKKYVDTKKAKIIFRNYIDDTASFEATKLVRFFCKENTAEFLKMSKKIYNNIDQWMKSKDPKEFLRNLFVGDVINNNKITKEMVEYVLEENKKRSKNQKMPESTRVAAGIMKEMQRAMFKYNVYSMPAFIVTSISLKKLDTLPFDDIKKYIHEGNISAEKLGELVDEKQTYSKAPKGTKISS